MFGTQHHQLYNSSSLKNNFNGARSTELPSGQKRPHHFSHGHKFQNNGQFYNNGFRGTNGRDNYLQHWCETCDRGFKTAEMLENHISEHQKCGIDGCKFVGHPKVVTKHIEMQHSTGLFNRIKNLETPEDVANWISERKKKYPSKENIEKQNAAKKECLDRGEKLRDQKSKFNRRDKKSNFKEKRNRPQIKNFHNKEIDTDKIQNTNVEKNLVPCVKIVDPTEEEIYYGIQAFKGTSQLDCFNEYPEDIAIIDNNIEIEDDEWEEQATSPLKTKIMCQGLSSLMSAYQSSSEEEDIENSSNATTTLNSSKCILKPITSKGLICENKMSKMEEIKCLIDNNDDGNSSNTKIVLNSSTCTLRPITTKGLVCENKTSKIEETKCLIENNDDDSGPESAPIERSNCIYNKEMEIVKDEKIIVKNEKQNSKYQKRKHSDDRKSENHSKKTPRLNMPLNTFQKQLQYYKERPSTLLEKLLEKDIRHERNIILQCVNYIVKNDFFKK